MKYLDKKTGKEILVYPYQINLLLIIKNHPDRYLEMFEEE